MSDGSADGKRLLMADLARLFGQAADAVVSVLAEATGSMGSLNDQAIYDVIDGKRVWNAAANAEFRRLIETIRAQARQFLGDRAWR